MEIKDLNISLDTLIDMDNMIWFGIETNGQWLSNCCWELPLGEIDKYNTGMCSCCKEGALFEYEANTD